MATKVKPIRLQISGTPQAGDVPQYVDGDNFQWGSGSSITVVDALNSTSATDALSANQGKVLNDKISDLFGLGKFLSLWNATTGLPTSFPLQTPYTYSTGDYYLVSVVSSATPPVNYKPSGAQYTGTASSTTETEELEVGDLYIYDGTTWLLQINHGKTVSFANLAGQPEDNAALDSALDAKQDALTLPANPTNGNLVTWGADNETLVDGGAVPTVPTNVSAFTNDAGYITTASLAGNATSSTAGIVKLASDTVQSESAQTVSSTSGRTYGVQFNSSNQMVVNVPRTDTDTTYTAGTNIQISSGNVISATGGSEIEYKTQAEYTALLPGAASDGKHYFIYTSSGGGGWTPGANTLAYYPLTSTSQGNDMKGSGTAYNLSVSGTVTYTTVGGISVMQGGSGYLSGAVATIPTGTSARTLSIWAYLTSSTPNGLYVMWHYGTASMHKNQLMCYNISDNLIRPYLSNNHDDLFNGDNTSNSTGQWYHILYTYDGTTQKLYNNNVKIAEQNISLSTQSTNLYVGGDGSNTNFTGYLSELIIEDKAWTVSDVDTYYNATKANYGIS